MSSSTVNISFRKDLLKLIDKMAQEESRTRSELVREAARMYIERKSRWNNIFQYGERHITELGLQEDDVMEEIKQIRYGRKHTRG